MQNVSAALVKAQKAFGPALKTNTNPHFKSKYADLSACIEAVIDALHANGIALVQRNLPTDSGVCIETVFVHESGESLSSGPLHVPAAKNDPQGYGSALTYARRYSLMAACGIAPEDDDGNAAVKAKQDQRNREREAWIRDWCAAIDAAASSEELKATVEDAVKAARDMKDADAEGQFLAAKATKIAKVRAQKGQTDAAPAA